MRKTHREGKTKVKKNPRGINPRHAQLEVSLLNPYLLTVVNTICDNNADDDGSSYEEDGDFWACSTLASSLFPCALAKRAVELSVSPSPSSSVPSSSLMGVSSS